MTSELERRDLAGGRPPLFVDRRDAGALLAVSLRRFRGTNPLVLGLARGGVVVAAEVAARLGGELDVVVVRKLAAQGWPELAVGAVTADGTRFLNDDVIAETRITESQLRRVSAAQAAAARDLEANLRDDRPRPRIRGRTVILVDDGLATGATMRAVVRSVSGSGPGRIVVAVPVGSREACAALRTEVDEVVCTAEPVRFVAVGSWYIDFRQVEDDEVRQCLADQRVRQGA